MSKTKTSVVKYKNKMQGGMPVHFPVCSKSMSGITHHKVANPYLELTQEEADLLVSTDPHNFEHADPAEYKAWQKSGGKHSDPVQNPRHVPAATPAPADASDAPEDDEATGETDDEPTGEADEPGPDGETTPENTPPDFPGQVVDHAGPPAAEPTETTPEKPAKAKKPRGGKKAAAPKKPKSSRKAKGKAAPEGEGK